MEVVVMVYRVIVIIIGSFLIWLMINKRFKENLRDIVGDCSVSGIIQVRVA